MTPDRDPRDETEARPQVGFRLKAGAYDAGAFFNMVRARSVSYHDLMTFDAVNGEVPGTLRFHWDTPKANVDAVADWLRSLPFVLAVFPGYGSPIRAV